LPIQEDETANVLYSLWKYYEKNGNLEFVTKVYDRLVVKAADFMMNYRYPENGLPKPTFDEWEEKVGTFTSTVASVCAALDSAAKFAKVFYDSNRQEKLSEASSQIREAMIKHLYDPHLRRFIKGIYPNGERDITDSSVSSVFTYEVLDAQDVRVKSTMKLASNLRVKQMLVKARHQDDRYRRVSPDTPGTHGLFHASSTMVHSYSNIMAGRFSDGFLKWTTNTPCPREL
jgi:GH15 family glucan-1,4-alpha-glucosidase